MKLEKLYELRRRKRISRKNLAKALNDFQCFCSSIDAKFNYTEQFIKQLETQDNSGLNPDILEVISQYFGITLEELTGKCYEDMLQDRIKKELSFKDIQIPEGIDKEDIDNLFRTLTKKYKILDNENIDQFISEFKYRIGDLQPHRLNNWKSFIKEMEEDVNRFLHEAKDEDEDIDNIYENINNDTKLDVDSTQKPYLRYEYPLEPTKDVELSIRQTAVISTIFYKELRAQGLSFDEAINIMKVVF